MAPRTGRQLASQPRSFCSSFAPGVTQQRNRQRKRLRLQCPCAFLAPDRQQQPDEKATEHNSIGRNILVAVDSSEDSKYALQWTAQELYCEGDMIHVAHCIPYLPINGGLYAFPDGRLAMIDVDHLLAGEEQYLLAEAQAVQRTCDEAFGDQQVAHTVDVLREEPLAAGEKGRIAEALCRKAEEVDAAALVIASHAKSGLSELVLGSVAAHCTARSRRPVLVLHAPREQGQEQAGILGRLASAAAQALGGNAELERQPQDAAAGAEEQPRGSCCSRGRTVVVAVDDSEESERACSWAAANLYRPGDTFHMLRIIPTVPHRVVSPAMDGLAFYSPSLTSAFKDATEHYVQHRLEPKLQAAGVPYQLDIVVDATDESVAGVGSSICRKAEQLQAAVVVISSHMRGGLMQFMLGSTAAHVARNCTQPVAVLH